MSVNGITYISNKNIDRTRWDACIAASSGGRIYAYSVYLDAMCRNWDALVLDDYKAVMPLTYNRKWGISYLYQPPFCAQLGVFGEHPDRSLVERFISALPAQFKLVEISLNPGNDALPPSPQCIYRNNYVLDLNKNYVDLAAAFRENVRRNAKKALDLNCRFRTDVALEEVLSLAEMQLRARKERNSDALDRFRHLYAVLHKQNMASCYGVFSDRNELLASAVFFFSQRRMYYILPGNHPNGRTLGASHLLIDQTIKQHAGSTLILDFEGSDVPSLAFFYAGFGAELEKYPALRINRLPWWLRIFKK